MPMTGNIVMAGKLSPRIEVAIMRRARHFRTQAIFLSHVEQVLAEIRTGFVDEVYFLGDGQCENADRAYVEVNRTTDCRTRVFILTHDRLTELGHPIDLLARFNTAPVDDRLAPGPACVLG